MKKTQSFSTAIAGISICFIASTAIASPISEVVSAGFIEAKQAKIPVLETNGLTGSFPNNNTEANYTPVNTSSYIVNIGARGTITTTYKNPVEIAGKTLTLTPTDLGYGVVKWACTTSGILDSAIPPSCISPSPSEIISESLATSGPAKVAITEYLAEMDRLPNSNTEVDFHFPNGMPYVISIGQGGTVIISYAAPDQLAGGNLTLTPIRSGSSVTGWTCQATNLSADLLPESCRQVSVDTSISQGIEHVISAGVSVTEFFMITGNFPNNNAQAQYSPPEGKPFSVQIVQGGGIVLDYLSPSSLAGKTVFFEPQQPAPEAGAITWKCTSPNIPADLLPSECR